MSRYFKVTDQTIIDGLKGHLALKGKLQDRAREWARSVGAENIYFYQDGFFGQRLGGFKPSECSDELREKCTIKRDRNGLIWPKKTVDRELYAAFRQVWDEVRVPSSETDELIGFDELSFFPTRPGVFVSKDRTFVGYVMPDHVTEVKGCAEITNIDWIEATKEADA